MKLKSKRKKLGLLNKISSFGLSRLKSKVIEEK